MTLACEANEKPVELAMPASLPECMRMSTRSTRLTTIWTTTRMAVSTRLSPWYQAGRP